MLENENENIGHYRRIDNDLSENERVQRRGSSQARLLQQPLVPDNSDVLIEMPLIGEERGNNNNISDQDESISTCVLCQNEIRAEERQKVQLPCKHLYCLECWIHYITAKIEDGFTNIRCINPDCTVILIEEKIRFLLQNRPVILERYERLIDKKQPLFNEDQKYCPRGNCGSLLNLVHKPIFFSLFSLEKQNLFFLKCEKNGHPICFACLKPYHKTSCHKFFQRNALDPAIIEGLRAKRYRLCPKCGIVTYRESGCPHIKCVSCGYDWCWICLQKYQIGHFNNLACASNDRTKMVAQNIENQNETYSKKWYQVFYEYFTGQIFCLTFLMGIIIVFEFQKQTNNPLLQLWDFFKKIILSVVLTPIFTVCGILVLCLSIFYPPLVNLFYTAFENWLKKQFNVYQRMDVIRNEMKLSRLKKRKFELYLGLKDYCKIYL